jgi:hypothetical protein
MTDAMAQAAVEVASAVACRDRINVIRPCSYIHDIDGFLAHTHDGAFPGREGPFGIRVGVL